MTEHQEQLITHLSLDWCSNHGTPVYLTLWDFSPPGIAASVGMSLGLGIWHSQLWLPDINTEIAFGGHDEEDYSGIFTLPREPYSFASPAARLPQIQCAKNQLVVDGLSHAFSQPQQVPSPGPSPLPDARYVGAWFMGYAGCSSTPANDPGPSTGRWAAPQTGTHAFKEVLYDPASTRPQARPTTTSSWISSLAPGASQSQFASGSSGLSKKASSEAQGRGRPLTIEVDRKHPKTSGVRARSVTFAMQSLQDLKSDPQWNGKTYDLLTHNCNHFTAVILERLTGAKLPAWINRTAGIGQVVSHIIPASLLVDLDTAAPDAVTDTGCLSSTDAGAGSAATPKSSFDDPSDSTRQSSSIVTRVAEELSSAAPVQHRPPDKYSGKSQH
ncbi:hypothetical protein OC846_006633 [Tilletia horrida]|uniref:PPPDE domain-containing protein n=1 Tax=Tilletia horrida TaxID=155126 RepID=A0AAN6JP72_9BASI|nr:hypothetical protein OC846_006633 [Tilletia horrida]KAK0558501.1 hypothetical protein OC861_006896 [Tilletia horrida]